MQDWESRALPSDGRVKRWNEQDGLWLEVSTTGAAFYPTRALGRAGFPDSADKPLWRPWKGNNPAPWSEFYAATHPPIPEGWEAVGEWATAGTAGGKPFMIKAAGENDFGSLHSGDGYRIRVRKVPPPADWGDVPRGVTLRPAHGPGGPSNGVFLNGVYVGRVFDVVDAGYYAHSAAQPPVAGSPFASLPAAIVALTGRREKA